MQLHPHLLNKRGCERALPQPQRRPQPLRQQPEQQLSRIFLLGPPGGRGSAEADVAQGGRVLQPPGERRLRRLELTQGDQLPPGAAVHLSHGLQLCRRQGGGRQRRAEVAVKREERMERGRGGGRGWVLKQRMEGRPRQQDRRADRCAHHAPCFSVATASLSALANSSMLRFWWAEGWCK